MSAKKKILSIGEILWDCFPKGKFIGGAPFNTACHLHMLGEDVKIVSRIGNDDPGKEALNRISERGMAADYIQIDNNQNTGIVNIAVDNSGIPSYEIVEPAAWDFIEYMDNLGKLAAKSEVLVFGSLAQRNPVSRNTISNLRKIIPVKVFDINLRPPYDNPDVVKDSLNSTQIVKLNDAELMQLSYWFSLPRDIKKAVLALASSFKCETICITRGDKGAVLWHNNTWTVHPGFKISVKDTVGSGDAFLASMISGILAGNDNDEILNDANALGAFVASRDGAVPSHDKDDIRRIKEGN